MLSFRRIHIFFISIYFIFSTCSLPGNTVLLHHVRSLFPTQTFRMRYTFSHVAGVGNRRKTDSSLRRRISMDILSVVGAVK